VLGNRLRAEVSPSEFSLRVHPIDEIDLRTESDIAENFHLSEIDVHKVVERGLLAVGGLNQRLAEMKAFTTISLIQRGGVTSI
jgi:hypothetical protein